MTAPSTMPSFHELAFGKMYHVHEKQKQTVIATVPVVRSAESAKPKPSSAKKRSRAQPIAASSTQIMFQLTERVDVDVMEAIYARRNELLPHGTATLFGKYVEEARKSNGSRVVTYRQLGHGFGRVYADGSLSLANFSRSLRSALARKLYYDIDSQNAHPRVLSAVARLNGWHVPALNHYITNRDSVVAEMPYPAEVAKQIFLAMTNGGSRISVLTKANLADRGSTPFADDFKHEMRTLAKNVFNKYTEYHAAISPTTSKNRHVTVMSFVMQELETRATLCAVEFFRAHGWDVGVVIHDGFLVYRQTDRELGVDLLKELQRVVHEKCGVDMPFCIKEFVAPLDFNAPERVSVVDPALSDAVLLDDEPVVHSCSAGPVS